MKIITLTLSCAYDVHCSLLKLSLGHENLASVSSFDIGGKGVNISRVLSAYGIPNTAVAVLGEENGGEFESALEKEGVSLRAVWDSGRIRENITLHSEDTEETRISFRGGAVSRDLLERVGESLFSLCDKETVLAVAGSLPEGIEISALKSLLCKLSARGVRLVIDSRSFSLSDLGEVKPYLIKPNAEEIAIYMNREINDTEGAVSAARELRAMGIENAMISLGSLGAVIATPSGVYKESAPKITPVSTVGAGDSTIAGFLIGLYSGEDVSAALRRAVAFGSAACLTEGTKPPRADVVASLLDNWKM